MHVYNHHKKIYFLSDFHLGAPNHAESLIREKRIVKFLNEIKDDAAEIFILGDLFDFWFEYKKVVPKGFVRILGKLAELTDAGIAIHFFVGNHDMWMNDYFEKELNISVYHHPEEFTFNEKRFFIGHGDGLGPGDKKYKFIKKVFRNKFSKWLFSIMHPGFGIGLANYFSRKSRIATGINDEVFLGEDKEWLISYSKEKLKAGHFDYFVFGHRHLPIDFKMNGATTYINLGDWIKYNSYAVFNGNTLELKYYKD
jgi:UDP-2,3-diacylglucosamine hydrolase